MMFDAVEREAIDEVTRRYREREQRIAEFRRAAVVLAKEDIDSWGHGVVTGSNPRQGPCRCAVCEKTRRVLELESKL